MTMQLNLEVVQSLIELGDRATYGHNWTRTSDPYDVNVVL